MGTNSKLHVQFDSRPWERLGFNGETYSDRGYQASWEVSRARPGRSGILVDYTGGTIGAGFGTGSPDQRAREFLRQIEPVLPGVSERWNGNAVVDFWPGYRWTKGSYSYWTVGQYTDFGGIEGRPEGNCHFAGRAHVDRIPGLPQRCRSDGGSGPRTRFSQACASGEPAGPVRFRSGHASALSASACSSAARLSRIVTLFGWSRPSVRSVIASARWRAERAPGRSPTCRSAPPRLLRRVPTVGWSGP
jgi:hypothetical protein